MGENWSVIAVIMSDISVILLLTLTSNISLMLELLSWKKKKYTLVKFLFFLPKQNKKRGEISDKEFV